MAYHRGPYSLPGANPPPDRPKMHSARAIDAPTQRYVLDDTTGAHTGMRALAQRVYIAVSKATPKARFVTPDGMEAERQRILAELKALSGGDNPDLQVLEVSVTRSGAGTIKRLVRYRNLTTGLEESVQL